MHFLPQSIASTRLLLHFFAQSYCAHYAKFCKASTLHAENCDLYVNNFPHQTIENRVNNIKKFEIEVFKDKYIAGMQKLENSLK